MLRLWAKSLAPWLIMALNLKDAHRERLVQILIAQSVNFGGTPQQFFIDLVKTTNPKLSTSFLMQAIALPKGNSPGADARAIVDWADNKGIYPQDSRYTVLGILLTPLLPSLGLEDASFIVALIFHYRLFREPGLLEPLTTTYQVPLLATSTPDSAPPSGPDFLWDDPRDYTELQTLIQQRQVTFLDVGFLQQAIQQATAVCRIELPDAQDATKRRFIGTGFLVALDLVITNYHVLAPEKDADIKAYVNRLELNFGHLSTSDQLATLTQPIRLAEQPIIKALGGAENS